MSTPKRVYQLTVFVEDRATRFSYNVNSQPLPRGAKLVCVIDRWGGRDYAVSWDDDRRASPTGPSLRQYIAEITKEVRATIQPVFSEAPWPD
jgi:hypothetical protein